MEDGLLAPVMHIEGAEAIDPNFEVLDVLYEAGLIRPEAIRRLVEQALQGLEKKSQRAAD